jgi:hypothetical protein
MAKEKSIAAVQRAIYADRKAAGLCPRCATKLTATERRAGNTYCQSDRAYLAERARERAAGEKLREVTGETAGMTARERWAYLRDRAISEGKCSLCLSRPAGPGAMKTCSTCRERRAAQRK